MTITYIRLIFLVLSLFFSLGKDLNFKYKYISNNESFTCDELTRWLGSEKHYSNDKKEIIFKFLMNQNCQNKLPVILLNSINYGWINKKRTYYTNSDLSNNITSNNAVSKGHKCIQHDDYAIAYLSNFSINNNFSHFLHGLLRLFCSLIDSRWLIWNEQSNTFIPQVSYTIWLDEYFKSSPIKLKWISSLGNNIRELKDITKGQCVSSNYLLYGSGCVKLLPPEKWFGYPGCRANEILPAFGYYMRNKYTASNSKDLILLDEQSPERKDIGLRVAFAVRDVGVITGRRSIANLHQVQQLLRSTQHIRTSTENVTFEHLDVASTIRYMASVHIFISVHGAGMTNMFFMNEGSAVVEIIPYPLCNCKSPDYFYGIGGYYHGSSIAQNIKHYPYCVTENNTIWHTKPTDLKADGKCSWKYLHAVDSVLLEPSLFVSLMRNVERDLIASGTIQLTRPVISMSPHANG